MSVFYSASPNSYVKTSMDMQYNVPMSYQTHPQVTAPPQPSSLTNPPFTTDSTTSFNLFGPLQKEYCIWFYFLSVIGFVLFVLLLISGIFLGLSKGKGAEYYYYLFIASLAYGIFYFQNRLLFTMCSKSL